MPIDFEPFFAKVQSFLSPRKGQAYGLHDTAYKLPLSDALFCAEDIPRNRAFFRATEQAIAELKKDRPFVRAVDAGSGTGILGAFALALGADRCVFIEHNPHSLALSRELIAYLGLADRSVFVEGDATRITPDEPCDLLISETLSSGFVDEDFPAIVNRLRRFGAGGSIIIPAAFELTLLEADEGGHILDEQTFALRSGDGFSKRTIELRNPATRHLTWRTRATLYGDTYLQSGDCASFLNERTIGVDQKHPLFKVVSPGGLEPPTPGL